MLPFFQKNKKSNENRSGTCLSGRGKMPRLCMANGYNYSSGFRVYIEIIESIKNSKFKI